jgi:hypothetical protein
MNFKRSIASFFVATNAYLSMGDVVFAHEGHGLSGPHLHSGDWLGFLVLAVAVGVAIYLSRGKK